MRIAKLVKEAMGHFEKCLFEVKDALQSLAFDLIEIDAEIDSRCLSLAYYALKPADGEPEWIPKSVRYRDTTHGLSKDMQALSVYKNIIEESNTLIDAVHKRLKQNCGLVTEQHLKDVQKARFDLIVSKYIIITKYILKAGMMEESIDTKLAGKTLKHQAG